MVAISLPIVLQNALALLVPFLTSHAVKYGRSGERHRAMRSDRANNILTVVTAMLRGCSLQHGGVICHFSGLWVRPLTIAEIATLAQICPKTVSRCIADLVDLGLIECTQIKRKNPRTGLFEVSIGIRKFTEKFWKAIELWDLFVKSCQWAKEHGRRRLIMPFKVVSLKINNTVKHASTLVGDVLNNLSEGAIRTKFWCNKILKNINKS